MKRLIAIGMLLMTLAHGWAAEIKFIWNPNTESDLVGYRMYQSINFFNTPSTNFVNVLAPLTTASSTVDFGRVYSYHLTAYNTAGLESDPSNELRFQLLFAIAASNITNSFTLTGFTNWQSAILTKPPTNGIITGIPPDIFYRSTNVTATKDNFTYSIQKQPMAGTNIVTNILNFLPVDDAYLQGTTRFNDNYLKVEAGNRVSYLKFNVSGLTGIVQNVMLRLQEKDDVGSGTLRVYRGSHNNWTETTLTSANAPSVSEQVGVFTGTVTSNQVVNVNVTPLLTEDGIYSMIMMMDVGGNDIWFGSKESTHPPQLLIETLSGIGHPVTNYFTVYYMFPNTPSVISDVDISWITIPSYQINPILLYTFKEGVGTNIFSSVLPGLPPVNLSVNNTTNIQWVTDGLRIVGPSIARSTNFATSLVDRIITANAFSVETWVTPDNITQLGPARIVSISTNNSFRNFTMGPSGTNYHARIRTSTTSLNGIPEPTSLYLQATNTVTTSKTHVVFTRSTSGESKLFINGDVKRITTIGGDLSNWDKTYELLLFNENTEERPWLGTIHSLAIYDRELNDSEVKYLYTPPVITDIEVFSF